jgi:hypothetical protein
MAAMGRNFYSNFVVCPKADLGVHCSIRKFGLVAAVRCTLPEGPLRAVHVEDIKGGEPTFAAKKMYSGAQ